MEIIAVEQLPEGFKQSQDDTVTFIYGHLEVKIRPPFLIRKRIKNFWWYKYQYWVTLEFVKMGPYEDLEEALDHYYMARIYNV